MPRFQRKIFIKSLALVFLTSSLLLSPTEYTSFLSSNPQCRRALRSLTEFALLVLCFVIFVDVCVSTLGSDVTGRLIFAPPDDNDDGCVDEKCDYELVRYNKGSDEEARKDDNDVNDEGSVTVVETVKSSDALILPSLSDGCKMIDTDKNLEIFTGEIKLISIRQPPSICSILDVAHNLLLALLVVILSISFISAAANKYGHGTYEWWGDVIRNGVVPFLPPFLLLLSIALAIISRTEMRQVVARTIIAPFLPVTFRDGLVGDVLTSLVRPARDVAISLSYMFCTVLIPSSVDPWILNTMILPACSVSPLWWRYCQTMRQALDNGKRWPYLGNAGKYFVAASAALIGSYHPRSRDAMWYHLLLAISTIYQAWWDVAMDWELLERVPFQHVEYQWSLRWLWWCCSGWTLRRERLYRSQWIYWIILIVNILLRFGWTFALIPDRRIITGVGEKVDIFDRMHMGAILGAAEIIRRTLWAFLRVELETLNTSDHRTKEKNTGKNNQCGIVMKPMSIDDIDINSDMKYVVGPPTVIELSIYAAAFALMALLVATHGN